MVRGARTWSTGPPAARTAPSPATPCPAGADRARRRGRVHARRARAPRQHRSRAGHRVLTAGRPLGPPELARVRTPELVAQRRSSSGKPKRKPRCLSRIGTARWLARSISSPMPPRPLATARRGAASAAGRRRTRPSVLVNSQVGDGLGRGDVDHAARAPRRAGPTRRPRAGRRGRSSSTTGRRRRARAQPGLEGGEHLGERPARAAEHDAEARRHDAHAGGGRRRGRRLPGATDVGEEARRRARRAR